jgi:hypothetical protein
MKIYDDDVLLSQSLDYSRWTEGLLWRSLVFSQRQIFVFQSFPKRGTGQFKRLPGRRFLFGKM